MGVAGRDGFGDSMVIRDEWGTIVNCGQ
jgi:hypothetical protein